MRYRAEAEHGSLTVVSAPGQGTLIRVSLPQAPAA
jgi:signal transduction histidine kinase